MTVKRHELNHSYGLNLLLYIQYILIYPESPFCLSDYRIWFVIGRHSWQGVHWVCWRQLYQAKKTTMWICVLVWDWHSFRYYRGSIWRMTMDKDTLHQVCMKLPIEGTASGGLFIISRTWINYLKLKLCDSFMRVQCLILLLQINVSQLESFIYDIKPQLTQSICPSVHGY